MGYYIQTNGNKNKAQTIAAKYKGEIWNVPPTNYAAIPDGKALIVVVDNGPFEAAGFCYDENEFEVFTDPRDDRFKEYVIIGRQDAEIASNYKR
jgi:hypothetical protein